MAFYRSAHTRCRTLPRIPQPRSGNAHLPLPRRSPSILPHAYYGRGVPRICILDSSFLRWRSFFDAITSSPTRIPHARGRLPSPQPTPARSAPITLRLPHRTRSAPSCLPSAHLDSLCCHLKPAREAENEGELLVALVIGSDHSLRQRAPSLIPNSAQAQVSPPRSTPPPLPSVDLDSSTPFTLTSFKSMASSPRHAWRAVGGPRHQLLASFFYS
jgi:hypothetical protein